MKLKKPEEIEVQTQKSEAWLSYRIGKIGGSDAAAVAGFSKQKHRQFLLCEKIGLIEPEPIGHLPHVMRGVALEPFALKKATEELGGKVTAGGVYEHEKESRFIASTDGICEELDTVIECKYAGKKNLHMLEKGIIPLQYFFQILHNAYVTEAKNALITATDGKKFVHYLYENILESGVARPPVEGAHTFPGGVLEYYVVQAEVFLQDIDLHKK